MPREPAKSLTRRIPKEIEVALRKYATVVGEVVWASNYAYGAFEILFSHLATPGNNFQTGRHLWHTAGSDGAKLKMLQVAATASPNLSKPMRGRILWTIEQARKLAERRNDAVHSATFVKLEQNGNSLLLISDVGTKPSRSEKLRAEPDLKKKFHALKGDLLQLAQYVHEIWPHIAGFDLLPRLPARPRFRSIPSSVSKKSKPKHAK